MSNDRFKTPAWLVLSAGVCIHTAIAMAWLYSTFETKSHADETKGDTVQRLQRIEEKLDRLIERK